MIHDIFSIELDPETFSRIVALSRETGESQSQVARGLIEEALRMRRHPGIVFRDGPTGRRAALLNGPDVWEVIPAVRDAKNPSNDAIAIAAESIGIPEARILDALKYYAEYTDEIDAWIERNERVADEARAAWEKSGASA